MWKLGDASFVILVVAGLVAAPEATLAFAAGAVVGWFTALVGSYGEEA
ncbi:hypothetical protein [Methylosinus sp. PW1]|nr:hypothetical protein [Methylosinus sp. PW1]